MISVCVATFNGEKYLAEQLDSILLNLEEGDELIISDDRSTDGTPEILAAYATRYPHKIRLLQNQGKGVAKNFETALSQAKGDLIFLADQDDIWAKDKVKTVKAVFRDHPECDMVVHDGLFVDGDNREIGGSIFSWRHCRRGLIRNFMKNGYVGCCMAFTQRVKNAALPFSDKIYMHDWWLGLVSEKCFRSFFLPVCLIRYRRHGGNVTTLKHDRFTKMLSRRFRFFLALCRVKRPKKSR